MCKAIGAVLKKIVKALKPILAVALLAFAAYAFFVIAGSTLGSVAALSWMPAGAATLTGTTAAYIALGAAVLIDGSTVGSIVGSAAKGVGKVAGAVVSGVVGGALAGVTGGNFWLYAIGGVALWYFLSSDDDKKKKETAKVEVQRSREEGVRA